MNVPAESNAGIVVAAHGRRGVIETQAGERAYVVSGRQLRPVCGDRVRWCEQARSPEALLTGIEDRRNSLARWHERSGRAETIAANVDRILIVLAAVPAADLNLVDRFLCAAELMGCTATIAWNKTDLGGLPADLAREFLGLGYECLAISAHDVASMNSLRSRLHGKISALVGQSGVGKSSILNALIPGTRQNVGDLSAGSESGTHTTTAVLMRTVPDASGARILDTPGVRSFLPATAADRTVARGFPEIYRLSPDCHFADCRHHQEPRCAVKDALQSGAITQRRYASYLQLAGLR